MSKLLIYIRILISLLSDIRRLVSITVAICVITIFIYNFYLSSPEVATAIIAGVSAITAQIWSTHNTKKAEIASRHFIEKKNAYEPLIKLMVKMMQQQKRKKKVSEEEMTKAIFEFKKSLMIWGNNEVIEALDKFERAGAENNLDANKLLLVADDLIVSMRKDLGHNDSQLSRGRILSLFIIQEDKDKLIQSAK